MGLAIFVILTEVATILLGIAALVIVQKVARKPKVTAALALLLVVWFFWSLFPSLPVYNHLCKEESGQFAAKRYKAESYLLVGEGGDRFDGLGVNTALDDVLARRVSFVELQKLHTNSQQLALSSHLQLDLWSADGRKQWDKPGAYRIAIAKAPSNSCRIHAGGRPPYGSRLGPNECISVEEIDSPSSRYAVTLFHRTPVPLMPITNFGVLIEDRVEGKEVAKLSVFEYIPRPTFIILLGDKNVWCPATRLQRQPRMTHLHGYVLFGGA